MKITLNVAKLKNKKFGIVAGKKILEEFSTLKESKKALSKQKYFYKFLAEEKKDFEENEIIKIYTNPSKGETLEI